MFNEDQKISLLKDLVAIKSINGNETKVAMYLKKLLADHNIDSEVISLSQDRANLFVEIGNGHPILALSGHMDVVDPSEISEWKYDPFTLTEDSGKLYGRGSTDMKSGLASMITAIIDLKENNVELNGTLRLLITAGEEVGEMGSEYFYKNGYMDDVDALVIAEPSSKKIIYTHKGSLNIRLESIGKAAHSSMPELGFNAIDPLISIINQANKHFRETMKTNKVLGPLTFNTDIISGGNQVNSIPDHAEAIINVRTIPEYTSEQVTKELKKIISNENEKGANVTLTIDMDAVPVSAPKDSTLSNVAAKLGKKYFTIDIEKIPIAGVTDASNLLKGKDSNFPFIMFGPGTTELAHKVDEYVLKDEYLMFSDIYVELIKTILK